MKKITEWIIDAEAARHFAVGAGAAALLAAFHFATNLLSQQNHMGTWRLIGEWAALLLIIVSGFAALSSIEMWLWRRRMAKKIPLPGIGTVDGQWFNAVVLNDQVTEAGIITITSSLADGFSFSGNSYPVKDQTISFDAEPSTFSGRQGSVFDAAGISYVFEGTLREPLHNEKKHSGVAYCTFSRGESHQQIAYFEGAFLARQEKVIRHVIGRSMPECLSSADAKDNLRLWVKNPKVGDFIKTIDAQQHKRVATAGTVSPE